MGPLGHYLSLLVPSLKKPPESYHEATKTNTKTMHLSNHDHDYSTQQSVDHLNSNRHGGGIRVSTGYQKHQVAHQLELGVEQTPNCWIDIWKLALVLCLALAPSQAQLGPAMGPGPFVWPPFGTN